VVICPASFDGGLGGESGDAPPGVPLADPAADVGFQGNDAAVGEAAQPAGGQLSEPAFHQVQPGRTAGPAGPARLPPQARFRRGPPDHRLRRPYRHQADRSANRLVYQEFVKTARCCRTIEVQAGRQTITAADPVPADLRQALSALNRPS
jgi:hypothetical protein